MIYDCFIFNSELELLDLRLAFLQDVVDYFVIVESRQTLSGQPKKLYYKENEERYLKYRPRVIYVECPVMPELSAWDYEYFQRNYIKQGLTRCSDNDLILISDLDEIVNLKSVLAMPGLTLPALIELPVSYYFFNLKSSYTFAVNLFARYDFIKEINIGCRIPDYSQKVKNVISHRRVNTGWHFSYLFGFQIEKYKQKIISFAHQEYNTSYFLNEERLYKCIKFGIDLVERGSVGFSFKNEKKELGDLYPFVRELGLLKYIYFPEFKDYFNFDSLYFIITRKYIPRIGYFLNQMFLAVIRPIWRICKPLLSRRERKEMLFKDK